MDEHLLEKLEARLGPLHARQRLGIEEDYQQQVFGEGFNFFHPENWYSLHAVLRYGLMLFGIHGRGSRNACRLQVRRNDIVIPGLPREFAGLTILHISDIHIDMDAANRAVLLNTVGGLEYDLCVLTGDYRARTSGPLAATLEGMHELNDRLQSPVYAVLGNHDSIRMVPDLEAMGMNMLLNENVAIRRGDSEIHLAGIDDAHYYRVDNIEKAAQAIPRDAVSILLSHTPEVYRQAAHAGFDVMLCGHTHGGQICLPGGVPVTLDARCPRRLGSGAWEYGGMAGYTSVGSGTSIVHARFNCPPEVTLHRLCGEPRRAGFSD